MTPKPTSKTSENNVASARSHDQEGASRPVPHHVPSQSFSERQVNRISEVSPNLEDTFLNEFEQQESVIIND